MSYRCRQGRKVTSGGRGAAIARFARCSSSLPVAFVPASAGSCSPTDPLILSLLARCTGPACDKLRELAANSDFDSVALKLCNKEGTITSLDVEKALYEVV